MNIRKLVFPVICGLIFASTVTYNMAFASNLPGSSDDPVVTKSYVDSKIADAISSKGGGELSEFQLEFVITEVTNNLLYGSGSVAATSSTYSPVSVANGQVVIGDEGTEIILRSGSAVGYSAGINGLVNATSGQEVENGSAVAINNLLIVPRGDGRGVRATSSAWLLIKGGYDIVG